MANRVSEFKAGCFVLFSLFVLVGGLLYLAGARLFRDRDTYYARFDFSAGVDANSIVRMAGVKVGRVREVRFLPVGDSLKVEMVLDIDPEVEIKSDSRIRINSIGLISEYYLEIDPGSPSSPTLPPGSVIPSEEIVTTAQVVRRLVSIEKSIEETVPLVQALFSPGETGSLVSLVENVNGMMDRGSSGFRSLLNSLALLSLRTDSLVIRLTEISNSVDLLLSGSRESFASTVNSLEESSRSISRLTADLQRVVHQVDRAVYVNQQELAGSLRNLNQALQNIKELSRELRSQPWKLLRKSELPRREGVE